MQKSNLLTYTIIMTVVNLIMKSAGVSFNAYLTAKIGSAGIGLFQLAMTVYSMAATFSCAGIRLAVTRATVEITASRKYDLNKSVAVCITYAGICGSLIGFLLFSFAGKIGLHWISDSNTVLPLRILSLSLPFSAMSSALGGYFTAVGKIPQYSVVQMLEQGSKIIIVVILLNRFSQMGMFYSCVAIVIGMTCSEIISFSLSSLLKKFTLPKKTDKNTIDPFRIFRVALPDAAGTCARSILLTIEHLLIPKGFKKSGAGSEAALAVYGNIHGLVMPILLYPSAVLSSFSSLLIPDLATKNEANDRHGINRSVVKNLKRTLIFSLVCSVFFWIFASPLSEMFCKNSEAAMYIKILSPLVPIMYTDMVTDGMLKGLDQQIYSMRYNILDSAICVILVWLVLPKCSVKGYIFILYASEIINFYLSINRLISVCDIEIFGKIRSFRERGGDSATFFPLKKCSDAQTACGYHTYPGQRKRSPDCLSYRRTFRIQDLRELR